MAPERENRSLAKGALVMTDAGDYPLHRPELFEQLALGDRALLHAMTQEGETKVFAARASIIRTGEAHDRVYRVRTGWVMRTRPLEDGRRQIISLFLPGDLVGLKSMLLARQPDGIESLTEAALDSLDQTRFRHLATTHSDIALRVMSALAEDERRLHNWVTALGRGRAEERLAAMMLDLRLRLRRVGLVPRNTFRLPMTQQQIGDYLGLTVVHVNRVLKHLRELGLVTIKEGTVVIHDLAGLGKLARPMLDIFEREVTETGINPPG
jgi:CRP-like cAMP-binding protein